MSGSAVCASSVLYRSFGNGINCFLRNWNYVFTNRTSFLRRSLFPHPQDTRLLSFKSAGTLAAVFCARWMPNKSVSGRSLRRIISCKQLAALNKCDCTIDEMSASARKRNYVSGERCKIQREKFYPLRFVV